MIITDNKNQIWYEVIVPDPSNLSGMFVASFLCLVAQFLGIKNVVLDDLSGANITKLSEGYMSTIVELNNIIELISKAVQFDWCNFLLFKDGGYIPDEKQSYAELISKTTATVRAVDDSDLYLYTQDESLVTELKSRYNTVTVNSGQLGTFVFPE